jgi:hypothetical protein
MITTFGLGQLDDVTVYGADQFYLLAQTYLDEYNPTAQLSGATDHINFGFA